MAQPSRLNTVLTFAVAQLLLLWVAVVTNDTKHSSVAADSLLRSLGSSNFEPPKIGVKAPPITVTTKDGVNTDLSASAAPFCVVFVAECQACVADEITGYDQVFKAGGRIAVVSRSTPAEVASAKTLYRWTVPIYTESTVLDPYWRAASRPWAVVVRRHQVLFSQSRESTTDNVLERVAQLVVTRHKRQNVSGTF